MVTLNMQRLKCDLIPSLSGQESQLAAGDHSSAHSDDGSKFTSEQHMKRKGGELELKLKNQTSHSKASTVSAGLSSKTASEDQSIPRLPQLPLAKVLGLKNSMVALPVTQPPQDDEELTLNPFPHSIVSSHCSPTSHSRQTPHRTSTLSGQRQLPPEDNLNQDDHYGTTVLHQPLVEFFSVGGNHTDRHSSIQDTSTSSDGQKDSMSEQFLQQEPNGPLLQTQHLYSTIGLGEHTGSKFTDGWRYDFQSGHDEDNEAATFTSGCETEMQAQLLRNGENQPALCHASGHNRYLVYKSEEPPPGPEQNRRDRGNIPLAVSTDPLPASHSWEAGDNETECRRCAFSPGLKTSISEDRAKRMAILERYHTQQRQSYLQVMAEQRQSCQQLFAQQNQELLQLLS